MEKLLQDIGFGKLIQIMRKNKHLTQEQIVIKMQQLGSSMSRDTYSKIEAGKRNIYMSDFIILKIVLDVKYSDFFIEYENRIRDAI